MIAEHRGTSKRAIPGHLSAATRLQRDILRTIVYFDIFHHPLRAEEIFRFLPSNSTSVNEVSFACTTSPLKSFMTRSGGYFRLTTSSPQLSDSRAEKERRATRYWIVAKLVGRLIRLFPFVRAVFVSGELSKGVLEKHGDIDFLIVTARRRLWITRTLLILFKKVFLLNSKKFFCVNHFVTESHLEASERNFYTALEIATLKPVYNEALLVEYLQRNIWIKEYFPNVDVPEKRHDVKRRRSLVQALFELPLVGRRGDRLDDSLLEMWKRIWKRRYPDLPEAKRGQLFRCEQNLSTAYGGDFLNRILSEYQTRLRQVGLEDAG